MSRFAALSLPLLMIAGATTAQAQPVTGYVAVPAKAPSKASFIVRDRMWKCEKAGACAGPKSTGNQNTACALAVRRLGVLSAFQVDGRAFEEATLAKCNEQAD